MFLLIAPSSPPLQLMAEKTSDSISLTWDAPPYESQNGIISQYVIHILEYDTSTTALYYSNTTNTTVNGLHPYYIYKCSVAAMTVDIGPYTAVITLQLDEDSESLLSTQHWYASNILCVNYTIECGLRTSKLSLFEQNTSTRTLQIKLAMAANQVDLNV